MNEQDKKSNTLHIEITADGSATLFVEELDEHYHSVKGALTESNHIYRDCAFMHRYVCSPLPEKPLRLLEVGFGTGLNACVTAMISDKERPVHYITLEKYPIDKHLLERLHYNQHTDSHLFNAIHQAEWNTPTPITPYFTLEKREADFLTDELPMGIDVVYFDAFAPEKQPEMWSRTAFERLIAVMNPGAILTTYCAKGEIRRLMKSLGLEVERISGPIGGKREILRGKK